MTPLAESAKHHLADLLDAIHRCVYFLEAADTRVLWPLDADYLATHKKDTVLFGNLAAINERFAKLQDTLGAAMRHAMPLLGESSDTFIRVLAYYEKVGVIDSASEWQSSRTARNLAAHAYELDYTMIADHFNTLHDLRPYLYLAANRFESYCKSQLGLAPTSGDFSTEFDSITKPLNARP
jgi:hypothetical protein